MSICIPSFVAWTGTWKIIVGICWDYLSELDGIGSFVPWSKKMLIDDCWEYVRIYIFIYI